MFYSNKSSILVSGEGNSSRSKMTSFMRILNLERIVFLMCIVSSGEITCGTEDDNAILKDEIKDKITVIKLKINSEEQMDHNYNVVLLGDTKVGKTQIINKYEDGFLYDNYVHTISIGDTEIYYSCEFKQRHLQKKTKLKIYDTPGQEAYKSILLNFVNKAQAIVLVYDVTQKDSFNNIKDNWLSWAKDYNPDAVYFLVGNKTNLEGDGQVTNEEAQDFAKEKDMRFFEVSAIDGNSIDELFKDIVKECLIKNLNLNYNDVIDQEPGAPILISHPRSITDIREEINPLKEEISKGNKKINDNNNTNQSIENIITKNNTTKESTCRNCCSCCCNC